MFAVAIMPLEAIVLDDVIAPETSRVTNNPIATTAAVDPITTFFFSNCVFPYGRSIGKVKR
jgi:hypothetical protein